MGFANEIVPPDVDLNANGVTSPHSAAEAMPAGEAPPENCPSSVKPLILIRA